MVESLFIVAPITCGGFEFGSSFAVLCVFLFLQPSFLAEEERNACSSCCLITVSVMCPVVCCAVCDCGSS